MDRMRILYFHQHFSTPKGSTGIRSYQMARRLLERGHRVTMVCGSYDQGRTGLAGDFIKGQRRGMVDGIEVVELELSYSNKLNLLARAGQFLRYALSSTLLVWTEQFDVIVASSTPLTAAIPGIAACLRRRPFIFEVRDLWPELPRAMGVIRSPVLLAMLRLLEWLGYRSATRLIGLAPGIVAGIRQGGAGKKPIAMIPNGCDIDLFGGLRPAAARVFDHTHPLTAVFSGTHGMANGLNAVLDAAAVLRRRGDRRIRFVLIGEGKEKKLLQDRATREKLDNVEFLSPVDKATLAALLRRADVGLQILANVPAFYYGTSPNKFFDYLAAGLPVLTNYPGWIADLITDRDCGIAVPPDDPIAFAEALRTLVDRAPLLPEMGKRAAALAREKFDRGALADAWVDFVTADLLADVGRAGQALHEVHR